jgi:hypothetical protein
MSRDDDETLVSEREEVTCAQCGRVTVDEQCNGCGMPLCAGCFEGGVGLCTACHSPNMPICLNEKAAT